MIHIVTVHYKNDFWVDKQLEYLEKNIKQSYKVYACLNELKKDHSSKFFYSSDYNPSGEFNHADKLNFLAAKVIEQANDKDLIMFLDSDAFPITELIPILKDKMKDNKLIAVMRKENNEQKQPHPCFAICNVGFWKKIKGDWRGGYKWKDKYGRKVTDVGGNLLEILEKNHIKWYPLLRSNKKNIHPLWFGVYGNVIYHHGAGSRSIPLSSMDRFNKNFIQRLILLIKNKILIRYMMNKVKKDKDFYLELI